MKDISIIRSNRKTLAIQVNPDLSVTVRAPRRASARDIDRILQEKAAWIEKQRERMRQRAASDAAAEPKKLSEAQLRELAERAVSYIPGRVSYYAKQIGVTYGRITIRNQKTRWGSCSSKGNLNFNCLLMLMPPEIIDYVVVHELCHRIEMNHCAAFWREFARILPDYKSAEAWLKREGGVIMRSQGVR